MIFVTVGTHEQPFNRLLKCIDKMKGEGLIKEEVIIQSGYSTYEPQYCQWRKIFPYDEMIKNVNDARIVITHGGPSSFIMPLQIGKVPIVVPRRKKYDEHVNDHQIEFCSVVAKRQGNIVIVEEIEELSKIILEYDSIIKAMSSTMKSNNAKFNEELEKIVQEIMQ